jgi:hypothetical protein
MERIAPPLVPLAVVADAPAIALDAARRDDDPTRIARWRLARHARIARWVLARHATRRKALLR